METTNRTDTFVFAQIAATVAAAITVAAAVSPIWYDWRPSVGDVTVAAILTLFARAETRRVRRERKLRRILRRYPGRVITTRLP